MFASVDGTGRFNLWNLNMDTEVPVVSVTPGNHRALNKVAWDKEGRKAAVGGLEGAVYVYDIGEVSDQSNITSILSKRLMLSHRWVLRVWRSGLCSRRLLTR
jgi:WD40 repeat protein